MNKEKSFSIYGLFIWALAILFYFYEFFLRVLPATISSKIVDGLDISIEQFALIGSGYYLAYALMQIPVGVLLDRFSIRALVTVAAGLCAFGALWFGFSQGFASAFISRLLIGIGSSFGFVTLMVVTLTWFPKKYFAFMLGWGVSLGAIGPLAAGVPIALLLKAVHGDWRFIFLYVALFGFILTGLIGIFLKGQKTDPDEILFIDRTTLGKQINELFKKSQIWWTMAFASVIYVSIPLIGAFWGIAFLESKGFDKPAASSIIAMLWIGLAMGSPLMGKLSDKYQRRVPCLAMCAILGLISSICVIFGGVINKFYLGALFFFIGFAGGGQSLSFAVVAENAPKNLRATALGMNNTSIMGFAAIIPPFVTSIIQHYTTGDTVTTAAFEKGLTVIPICFLIALIVALLGVKETFCRQQGEMHILEKDSKDL